MNGSTTIEHRMLSGLVRKPVRDGRGNVIGALSDIVVRLGLEGYPSVAGLVARVGSTSVFIPAADVSDLTDDGAVLSSARLDLRPFKRRPGEVLLKEAVLGHRLVDVGNARLVRAYDVCLERTPTGWAATGLDVTPPNWLGRRRAGESSLRDWKGFDVLIGHAPSATLRARWKRFDGLRAAEIADLIEDATQPERDDLFQHLHGDPELEADVIEELDDDEQAKVLKSRDTADIAAVLSRMHADDVVDAVLDLPQERRQAVVDALPEPQRRDVLRLMRYQGRSAGGMMGIEYVALPASATVEQAIAAVRTARTQQPQALTTVYLTEDEQRLSGAVTIVALVQADSTSSLKDIAEAGAVSVVPSDDVVTVVTLMSDYNLLSLPVVNDADEIVGIITVDDALEEAIPDDWQQRERRRHTS